MDNQEWWLGIDGGGSGTQAILANRLSNERYYSETGATNRNSQSEAEIQQRLAYLLSDITSQAKIGISEITATCFSGAGIDTSQDEIIMERLLNHLGLKGTIRVCNDAHAALAGGNSGNQGAIIICGTGSIALGVKDQEHFRVGGWGHLVSDEGSGWFLGIQAIRQVLRAYDGRGKETTLKNVLSRYHDLASTDAIMNCLYQSGSGKKRIAALAPSVLLAAESGDKVAKEIVCGGIEGLIDLTDALVNQMGNESFRLCYGGSLLIKSEYYRTLFETAVRQKYPTLNCHLPDAGPLEGALKMLEAHFQKER